MWRGKKRSCSVSLVGENAQESAWCVYPWQKRFAIKLLITPSHHKTEGHNIFGITMTLTRGTPHMSLAKRLIEHQQKKQYHHVVSPDSLRWNHYRTPLPPPPPPPSFSSISMAESAALRTSVVHFLFLISQFTQSRKLNFLSSLCLMDFAWRLTAMDYFLDVFGTFLYYFWQSSLLWFVVVYMPRYILIKLWLVIKPSKPMSLWSQGESMGFWLDLTILVFMYSSFA